MVALLVVLVVGLVIGSVLGWEFGVPGLLFLAVGLPGSLVVAVCYYATAGIRKTAAVIAVALMPAWIAAGLMGTFTGLPDPDLLMTSGVGGRSYVGSMVQGLVIITAIQGGVVLFKQRTKLARAPRIPNQDQAGHQDKCAVATVSS